MKNAHNSFNEFAREILESEEIKRKKRWLDYCENRWKIIRDDKKKKEEEEEQTIMLLLLWLWLLLDECDSAQEFFTQSRKTWDTPRSQRDTDLITPLKLASAKLFFGEEKVMKATLWHDIDGNPIKNKDAENRMKSAFFAPQIKPEISIEEGAHAPGFVPFEEARPHN